MDTSQVFNIPMLCGNKVKPTSERFGLWLLTENLHNDNLVTDIGKIDYTAGEELLVQDGSNLVPITEPFCDNIMLVKVCDLVDCQELDKRRFVLKKEICGAFNLYLRGTFSKMVSAKHGVKAKLPYLLDSESDMSKKILQVLGEDNYKEVKQKYQNPVGIPYKVELADVPIATLMEKLPTLLEQLRKEHFYLLDLDITQDFAGIFNKSGMCDFLTTNHAFCFQGVYKEDYNVIVDNDKTVGIDCLTWVNNNVRVKIYNKFICQMTSPGVDKQLGNHIVDFIDCPDARLRETFTSDLARMHGITRLEATIYNYSIRECYNFKTFDPIQDSLLLLNDSKAYFQNAPIFSVSLAKMWIKLSDNLKNSCCLVYNNLLQYVYWGNSNTKKLTGVQIKLPTNPQHRNKIISYVISAYSFNLLPINYVEICEDTDNRDNISFIQKCYIKSGETYFSKSTTVFSTISKNVNLDELGLVATVNLIPQVLRKRANITCKLLPYPVKEIQPLSPITVLSARKRKLELDEIELKRRKIEFLETTESIKKEHRQLLEFEKEIENLRDELEPYFYSHWKNFEPSGVYNVTAFTVNNKGKFPYVGVLGEKDGVRDVFFVKGFHKNVFLNAYNQIENLKKVGYFVISYGNGKYIICLPREEAICVITTNGMSSYNGNTFPKIEKLEFLSDIWKNLEGTPFTQTEVEEFNNITMLEIKGKVKVGQCKRLEELQEGTELVIVAIKQVYTRNKIRYILQFENLEKLYVSNYWLEEEIENSDIDLNYKIRIKLDALKHNPSRHKERVVFCI